MIAARFLSILIVVLAQFGAACLAQSAPESGRGKTAL